MTKAQKEDCVLTGTGETATQAFGLHGTDLGASFLYAGRVWWMFGDSGPTATFTYNGTTYDNLSPRFPKNPSVLANDSIGSSARTKPGQCPALVFPTAGSPVPGAFTSPRVMPDPISPPGVEVSLQTDETPVDAIAVHRHVYGVFSTDNPADAQCRALGQQNCPLGRSTRSVLGVLTNPASLQFEGLYSLSSPATRYLDGAKFIEVSLVASKHYIWIFGVQGGNQANSSLAYLARVTPSQIANQSAITYFHGLAKNGAPIFTNKNPLQAKPLFRNPACLAYVGVQYNPYLGRWLMIYDCKSASPPGIYMRTAPYPFGPWSKQQLLFNPATNSTTKTGYCYFIHSTSSCPAGAPNPCDKSTTCMPSDGLQGLYYAPYFVAGWTTGARGTVGKRARTTVRYTISTLDPYGQVIVQSTIVGPPITPSPPKFMPPPCGRFCV